MILHDVEQGSPEWFAARAEKMTASNAQAIGNYGKGLETYIIDMMAEKYSSAEPYHFSSKDTERGNLLEPIARKIYEFENDVEVRQVGFIEYNEYVGASPDGLVNEDGGTEIKCIDDYKYFRHLLLSEKEKEQMKLVDPGHLWQIQMNLLITGRKWWDLIVYNPNFKKSTCVYRICPDAEKFAELEKGFQMGAELINKIKAKLQ